MTDVINYAVLVLDNTIVVDHWPLDEPIPVPDDDV